MRRIIAWLRSWFVGAAVWRKLSTAEKRLSALAEKSQQASSALDVRAEELAAVVVRVEDAIEESRRIQQQYDATLEEAREQNRALEQTIQTLVASHRLLLERYDAETAIQVRLRTAAAQRE